MKQDDGIPEKVLTLHLALEAGDVSVAEVLAELLNLLQLQQVNPEHLDPTDHLNTGPCRYFGAFEDTSGPP